MNEQINSMFEVATRKKLRFPSSKGELSLEQLWDVPLTSKDGFDLNGVAVAANNALKEIAEESFVAVRRSPREGKLQLTLDLVKHVISTKLDEADAASRRKENSQQKTKLLDALARQEDKKLETMTPAQLRRAIEKLDA